MPADLGPTSLQVMANFDLFATAQRYESALPRTCHSHHRNEDIRGSGLDPGLFLHDEGVGIR